MLRTVSQRLFAAGRVAQQRPLSSSSTLLVRVRHPDGSTTSPDTTPSKSAPPAQPASPAEKPSSPPPSTTSAPPFEPQVHRPAGGAPPPPPPVTESTTTEANIPVTPPPVEDEPVKRDLRSLPSLDVDSEMARILQEAEPKKIEGDANEGGPRKRTGAGRKEYVSSIEKQRKLWFRLGLASVAIGGVSMALLNGQDDAAKSDVSQLERIKSNVSEFFDIFSKPAFTQLLPDPLPAPHQRPYTLLVDLEGLLVTSTWDRTNGWRTAKRPGVDYFLAYLSLFYEVVLFTNQPLYTAAPVAEKLDPFQAYLPYKLFRESTRTVDGKVVKDLSYLNRDLSKVIMLDTNAEHAALQPENAIIIKPWEGKGGESGLVDLIPFLESIAFYNVKDVRPTLKAYSGKDIPQEYAKIEAEQKKTAQAEWERVHPNSVHGAGSSYLSSMFGSVSAPGKTRQNQPQTYIEQKRAEAQRQYQEEQKYWKDNAAEFQKLIEEDKQRQLAEMKGSLLSFMGGAPPPKPEEKKA